MYILIGILTSLFYLARETKQIKIALKNAVRGIQKGVTHRSIGNVDRLKSMTS